MKQPRLITKIGFNRRKNSIQISAVLRNIFHRNLDRLTIETKCKLCRLTGLFNFLTKFTINYTVLSMLKHTTSPMASHNQAAIRTEQYMMKTRLNFKPDKEHTLELWFNNNSCSSLHKCYCGEDYKITKNIVV